MIASLNLLIIDGLSGSVSRVAIIYIGIALYIYVKNLFLKCPAFLLKVLLFLRKCPAFIIFHLVALLITETVNFNLSTVIYIIYLYFIPIT
jgi:hypothetical protein